jgi:DNA (cytosine-5)-methyltransferase 1
MKGTLTSTKTNLEIATAKKISPNIIPIERLNKLDTKNGFIDLFCGAGGFTIGFGRAGWRPLLGIDINPFVSETHKHNFPTINFLEKDLSNKETIEDIEKLYRGKEVGIVVGGPPCQGFSIFGKRRFVNTKGYDPHSDPRNKLVYSFLDVVKIVTPRWVVMENVPGFANLDKGLFLQTVLSELKSLGYANAEARILNAADYGVPQLRKRLVIIANRTGHIIPWAKRKFFAEPEDWQDDYRTVGEVISDLAENSSYETHTCHVPMKHKPLLVERYSYIQEGKRLNIDDLPEHLKVGYRTDEVKNFSHVFKRLNRNTPAFTMVPGHNAFPIHPWLNRAITVREAARIQTFPDEVEFKGTRQEQCIQVGNAFPPLLAEIIANNIKKAEVNNWYPDNVPPSAYYSLIEKEASYQIVKNYEMVDFATA